MLDFAILFRVMFIFELVYLQCIQTSHFICFVLILINSETFIVTI